MDLKHATTDNHLHKKTSHLPVLNWALGYNRDMAANTTFIAEVAENDGDDETSFAVGVKHTF